MNARAAFEAYVKPDCRQHRRSKQDSVYRLNRWARMSGDPPVKRITTETFREYRAKCRAKNYSPDTIESDIVTVMQALRMCARKGVIREAPWPGTPLGKRSSPRWVPTLDDIGRCYRQTGTTTWPSENSADFWRVYLTLALYLGFRRCDLLYRLRWDGLTDDSISLTASKTNRLHILPMHPVVKRHLDLLPRTGPTVFGVGKSLKQIKRELDRISDAAGVSPRLTPQSIRRLSISNWEECAGVGRMVHGCSSDVAARHYLQLRRPPKQLVDAAQHFRWPASMLTPEDVDAMANNEFRALKILRAMRGRDAELWLETGERMGA